MEADKIVHLKLECFSCSYGHSCKYYNNILWDQWICEHPEEGCPAKKYPFEALYQALIMESKNGNRRL